MQNAIATTKSTISNAQAQLDKDNQKIAKSDTGKDEGNKGTTTPTNPSKDDNKGSETTNPTNPVKPDDGKKDDNQGTTTPSESSKGDDQKDHQTTPVEPSKPSDGNRGNVTPTDPNKDNKGSETTNPTTPSNPTTPAQPDTGNASISGQAGHKPATSVNGSEASDNTDTKPTIVLPTTDKENGSAVSGAQGQNTTMTREQYKAQQAKLPQTGNNDSKAVIALGVLAGMFGFGLVTKGKKEF